MNTPYNFKTPKLQPNIPLLDKGFDARSTEVDDFITSHTPAQNDDFYTVRLYEIEEKITQ